MAHEDAGHYAGKHSKDTKINLEIAKAIKEKIKDGKISCAAAHTVSEDLSVQVSETGINIDLQEIRLSKCQLGLFGYGGKKKLVKPAEKITSKLETAINNRVKDTCISCFHCWEIAREEKCSKLDVANGCEAMKIKITPCQLGAF